MSAPDRIIAIGSVFVGLGAAIGVPYYIYSLEFEQTFWSWPGVVAVINTGIGLLLLGLGCFGRKDDALGQQQSGGDGSNNYQAGRNLTIERARDANN